VFAKNNYGEWERVIVTYTNNTNADLENVFIYFYPARGVGEVTYFTCPKIEKGSQATPWTPAPEDYANYDYKNKECNIELGLTLPDESVEYVSIGKFTVENAVRKNNTITLNCVDRMYKAEKDYVSDLKYPTTLGEILQSACEQAGIPLATTTFANSDYIVPNEPVFKGVTCRKVFAQVAELAGGYAKINRLGQLEIVTLGNESVRDITKDHYFDLKINEVAEASIDKVIVKVGEETATKGDGENIYTVVDNMFVQDPNDVVDALYNVLKNVSYTACTLKWQGDFSLDLGDKVTVDGNDIYVLSRKLTYTGGLREDYTAPAKSNIEKESTGKGSLTLDIENVKTQVKVLSGEISQTIERVENLVVGANNRLFDSQTGIEFGFNSGSGTIQLFRHQIHPYYKVVSNGNIDLFAAFSDSQFAEPLGELGEVTISLEVLVEVDRKVNIDGKEFDVKGNRWTRIHVTKEFNEENTTKRLRVRNPFSRKHTRDTKIGTKLIESLSTNINTLYYRNLKVERGNVVTEWTLTPEELEVNVDRMGSEIKQLADSISMIARRNENTGRLEVTPKSIVAAINTTEGVGRVKTVGVTINENGLTVENGAVIIRDAFNTAIITSNGLKVMYSFSSAGQYQGWQMVGICGVGSFHLNSYEASIPVQIPEKLIIEKATLYAHCAPAYITGARTYEPDVPDGLYYPRNLALYVRDFDATVFDCPWGSEYEVWYGSGGLEISSAVWGGRWTPNGEGVVTKLGNVKNYLTPGERTVFVVQSADSPTHSNRMRFGIMKFDLVIEGFLRG